MTGRGSHLVHAAAAGVILAWLGACVWLLGDGRYAAFLSAKLWPLLVAAAAMLVLMLGAMVRRPAAKGAMLPRLVAAGWVALPLAYLAAAPRGGLDSFALQNRGVDPLAHATIQTGPTDSAPAQGEHVEGVEVSLLHLLLDMQHYEGKTVSAIGMVHHDPAAPEGHFVLFRFVVVCCAADGSPVGAMVRVADAASHEADTWVRVTGRVELVPRGLDRGPCLVAETIESIDPPRELYLSPW